MSEIKVGDTVRLKSGGPLMTVETIDNYGTGASPVMKANCIWFDGTNKKESLFVLASLELEEEE